MSLHIVAAGNRGGWKPGQSGNPKGGASDRTLQELCRARTAECVHALIVMMRTKSANQLPATLALLDRGWGRPAQRIETDGASHLHLHLLAAQLIEPGVLPPDAGAHDQPQQPLVIEGSVPTE